MSKSKHARLFLPDLQLIADLKPAELKVFLGLRYGGFLRVDKYTITTTYNKGLAYLSQIMCCSPATIRRGLNGLKARDLLTIKRRPSISAIITLVVDQSHGDTLDSSHGDSSGSINMKSNPERSHDERSIYTKQNNKLKTNIYLIEDNFKIDF